MGSEVNTDHYRPGMLIKSARATYVWKLVSKLSGDDNCWWAYPVFNADEFVLGKEKPLEICVTDTVKLDALMLGRFYGQLNLLKDELDRSNQ